MYKKLKDRKPVKGFTVLNERGTQRAKVPTLHSPTGIPIATYMGFLMDQQGNLYAVDEVGHAIRVDEDQFKAVEGK